MTPLPASIPQAFADDHERMRAILKRAATACRDSAQRDARVAFRAFAADLRRHIRVEDEVLFPVFEVHTGLRDRGPTAVMRHEHRAIEARLDRIDAALANDTELELVERSLLELGSVLADHDRREEMVLYPACERIFSGRERIQAVQALTTDARAQQVAP
jgi:iron-sulfur cluster repair protein YtfE (RIC family)